LRFPYQTILLLLLSAASNPAGLSAQPASYIFRHINSNDGLVSNNVTGIVQDSKGFMWIATSDGLQKYDGYNFTTYHHNPGNPASLSADNATFLTRDAQQNIWMFTAFSGCNKINPVTSRNTRITDFRDTTFPNLDGTVSACLDNGGDLWLLAITTIAKYDGHRQQLTSYQQVLPKDPDIGLTARIVCDPKTNNLWMNSAKYGVCMLDAHRKTFYYQLNNPDSLPVFSMVEPAGALFLDQDHTLWINTYKGNLYRYFLDTRRLQQFHFPTPIYVSYFLQDSRGGIWAGTSNAGLLQYLPATDSFRTIKRTTADMGGLQYDKGINCLYEDKETNIWIGTDRGINVFNPYRQKFISIPNQPSASPAPEESTALRFRQDKNDDIWVATYYRGIQVFDKHLKFLKYYSHDPKTPYSLQEPEDRIWSFIDQPDGSTWVGAQHGWLSVYNPNSDDFISTQPNELDQKTILAMTSDRDHNTWLSLFSGIAKYDWQKKSFIHYTNIISYRGKSISQVNDILIDGQQRWWVATLTNGLQQFDPQTGKFIKLYAPEPGNTSSISSNTILSLAALNDSILAVATTGGIDLFNKNSGTFIHISAANGLPGNSVFAIHFEPPSYLWAVTDHGICRINTGNLHISTYGLEDGIIGNDFSSCLEFYKIRDGRLLVGYTGGLVCFHPDSIPAKEQPAPVTITAFNIHNQPFLSDSALNSPGPPIPLHHDQNFVSIHFASLSYLQPDRISYFYKLQDLDKDWVSAGHLRTASYASLPPGKYLFQVKCENGDGIPCGAITFLSFVISPSFWQTWWFKSLLALTAALLLTIIYRYRINQLLQVHALRDEISKDLHDDIGATLSTIRILSEVAKNKLESGQQETSYSLLSKISDHSLEMVEKMGDMVWSINPGKETIGDLILRLKGFALETCASKDIRLSINSNEPAFDQPLSMDLRKNLYLICKEAINNAIKHADCRQITVNFTLKAAFLDIFIADDGKGFDPASAKISNGLKNMHSRAKEIKATMTIYSIQKQTRLSILVPLPGFRYS
jgi:ligand-binding sensor domain-containing protein